MAARHIQDLFARLEKADREGAILGGGLTMLFMRMTVLSRLVSSFHDHVLKPEGIAYTDYQVLGLLRVIGPSSPRDLNRVLLRTTAGVTNVLDRLESRGYLQRTPSPTDGRSVVAKLTPEGRALAKRLEEVEAVAQRRALADLSASERKQFTKDLDRLIGLVRRDVPGG